MSGEVAFVELGVEDPERARGFYGALFGWTFEPGPSGGGGYLIRTPNVPAGVHGADPGAAPYVFFAVDDLAASVVRVRELGGTVDGVEDGADGSDGSVADADAADAAEAAVAADAAEAAVAADAAVAVAAAMETSLGRFLLCRDDQGSPFGLFQAPRAAEAVTP